MKHMQYYFGSYSNSESKVPVPDNLKSKDARADPVAKAAVFAANDLINKANITDCSNLSVIVVNREGCTSHVNRISDGLAKKVARQGFFARGGPQTLATYTALALGCHGAAYTLVGDKSVLDIALSSALYLTESMSSGVIVTVVVKKREAGFRAISVLIGAAEAHLDSSEFENIHKELACVYEQECDA